MSNDSPRGALVEELSSEDYALNLRHLWTALRLLRGLPLSSMRTMQERARLDRPLSVTPEVTRQNQRFEQDRIVTFEIERLLLRLESGGVKVQPARFVAAQSVKAPGKAN